MKLIFTRGNHDHIRSENKKNWVKTFGSPAGLITHKGVQIAWLNTYGSKLDWPENIKVINEIKTDLPLIIFTHYQLVPDNYVAAKDKEAVIKLMAGKKSVAEAPEAIKPLLEKIAGCKGVILVGHKNVAASARVGNMTQINVPQTTEYPAGGVALKVYSDGVQISFVPIDDMYAEEYSRRRMAESSGRLRHRTRYTYPIWNQFLKW